MNVPIENEENEDIEAIPDDVREQAEQLPGYKEYQRELRGDSLTFGDY